MYSIPICSRIHSSKTIFNNVFCTLSHPPSSLYHIPLFTLLFIALWLLFYYIFLFLSIPGNQEGAINDTFLIICYSSFFHPTSIQYLSSTIGFFEFSLLLSASASFSSLFFFSSLTSC